MTSILDEILRWAGTQLPESNRIWVSDLRDEAKHISGKLAQQTFLWSGVLAAGGEVLRVKFGARRVGQTLLGLGLLVLCLGGLLFAVGLESSALKTTLFCALPLYSVTGALALLDLKWMKYLTLYCSLTFGLIWLVSGFGFLIPMDGPFIFLRAFILEAAFMMAGLFVAASYLGWVEEPEHA